MCFNLQASLIAGSIGVTSGALMRTSLGIFVIWYSMVQFAEAALYAGCMRAVWDRILLILLGSQLGVFTAVTWVPNNPYYKAMALGGAALTVYSALTPMEPKESKGGIEYAFTDTSSRLMFLQYAIIIAAGAAQPQYRCAAGVFTATLVASILARPIAYASLWCWSSAVAGPLFLLACKS
tara:strand:+ start:197 stop:736 length:540 start_codon:yes stop_codon:yes gene_type:complete